LGYYKILLPWNWLIVQLQFKNCSIAFQRFLPTTIDEEREVVKEKHLQKDIEMLKSKIDRVKKEIEVLKLKKELKELEEENASLSSQGSK